MKHKSVLIMIATVGLFVGGAVAFAQQNRPYDQVMKDIGASFASLEQNLDLEENLDEDSAEAALDEDSAEAFMDEDSAEAVVQAATRLEGLFEEVEAFWTPFGTKSALDFTRAAREAAGEVATAARGNDIEMARKAYATMETSCGSCHFSHRWETISGFLIKP